MAELQGFYSTRVALACALCVFCADSHAHTTLSELVEMSLEDLIAVQVEGGLEEQRWQLGVQYARKKIEGYRSGSTDVSDQDVLWEPTETRTDFNFPVVPTVITQEVIAVSGVFQIRPDLGVEIEVPYVRQATDHISIVPGYDNFKIETEGFGDVKLSLRKEYSLANDTTVSTFIGLSFPTGSIDEQGDTPRAPGNQQLPYTMQLGSGTYDIPVSASVSKVKGSLQYGIATQYRLRLGHNDRNYRLGDVAVISGLIATRWGDWAHFSAALDWQHVESIDGGDSELTVPNPIFPYPASITNPRYFGGTSAKLRVGLRLRLPTNWSQSLLFTYTRNLYSDLNGVQPEEQSTLGLGWVLGF